jgi:hypothetical protein
MSSFGYEMVWSPSAIAPTYRSYFTETLLHQRAVNLSLRLTGYIDRDDGQPLTSQCVVDQCFSGRRAMRDTMERGTAVGTRCYLEASSMPEGGEVGRTQFDALACGSAGYFDRFGRWEVPRSDA